MQIPKRYMKRSSGITGNLLILKQVFLPAGNQRAFSYKTAGRGFYCKQEFQRLF